MTTIEELYDKEKVADIGLSDDETMLLQVSAVVTHDGPVGDVIMTDVDPEYRHCAKSKGSFANEDIEIDNIYDSVMGRAPGFVAEREGILSQKRIWPLRCAACHLEWMIDEGIFA